LAGREFIGLGRVQRDDVVDVLGDDQRVGGGGGIGRARCQRQGERGCQKGSAEELHVCFSLGLVFFVAGLWAPALDFATAGRGRAVERNSASVPVQRSRAGWSVWLDQEWGRLPRKCRLSPACITISSPSRRWVMAPSST